MKHYVVVYTNGDPGDKTWQVSASTYLGNAAGLSAARAYRDSHPGRALLIEVDDAAIVNHQPKPAAGGAQVIA